MLHHAGDEQAGALQEQVRILVDISACQASKLAKVREKAIKEGRQICYLVRLFPQHRDCR